VLNAKGISLVMASSRLLLLIQYCFAIVYSNAYPTYRKYQKSLIVHIITLGISSITYFVAFVVVGNHPSKGRSIAKLVLWFSPMILEILSYFLITRMEHHVECPPEKLSKRSTTLFIIILGEGLNQITSGFKFVVGAVGFTFQGAGIMISAAIIIISQVSLYFRNNRKPLSGVNRTYFWFFSQYIYLATVILTLQAVRYLMSFANLYSSITTLLAMAFNFTKTAYNNHNVQSITADQYPDARDAFLALGLPFKDFIDLVNWLLADRFNPVRLTKVAQTLIYVACVAFNEFDIFPDRGSVLYDRVQNFLSAPLVDIKKVYPLLGDLLASKLHSAFWFWGVAGGTLVMLAVMSSLRQKPTDKHDFVNIISSLFFGSIFIALSALTKGHNHPYFANGSTATTDLRTATAWKIASSAWVIPAFAITLIIVVCIDIIFKRFASSESKFDDGYNV